MRLIVKALEELWGLFVEDVSYAIVTAIWLLVVIFAFPHILVIARWRAILFVAGLLALLVENVIRTARQSKLIH
jgi:hypothetical protein